MSCQTAKKTAVICILVFLSSLPAFSETENRYVITPLILVMPSHTPWLSGLLNEGHYTAETILDHLVPYHQPESINSVDIVSKIRDSVKDSGGGFLVSPRITTNPAVPAAIQSIIPVEYFEKTENGLYSLQTIRDKAGVTLEMTVTDLKGESSDNRKSLEYQLDLTAVKGRKQLEGTTLPVGYPEFISRQISGQDSIDIGKWQLLCISTLTESDRCTQNTLIALIYIDQI